MPIIGKLLAYYCDTCGHSIKDDDTVVIDIKNKKVTCLTCNGKKEVKDE